ncbi:hypothetical protein NEMBOFW57_010132 [Staphylotrichum longicolle]|uniref:Uncharacterized protein n=1 Tax=Staphylotrichum longicolle TaxID=669026 RepID=A0AAD4EUA6_9PEZI|nr:hypothetical protein NEMBOFW57_010132 [Staphylotrichum longicolle]
MPGRARHACFEDEIQGPEIRPRRTRGTSGRRSSSADRVHSIFDEALNMQGRERVVGRDAYEQLMRENQYLRIELRGLEDAQTWIAQLQAENAELQRENRDLRRIPDYTSDNDARKDNKLSSLRKKYAKLEVELSDLKAKLSDWKTKAGDWRKLYEESKRSYESAKTKEEAATRIQQDLQRRLEIIRNNYSLEQAARGRLEQENASLRRSLELERLRRRQY